MIQFNLLPKVKLDYIKAKRAKRSTALISILAAGGAIALVVILFIAVNVVQKKYSNDLSKDIATETAKLNSIADLDKILTIQNQLSHLTALHDAKPVVSRLPGFIEQVTPAEVSIGRLSLDFSTNIIEIEGTADALSSVNKLVDTLKFTTYEAREVKDVNAFSEVVLAKFGRNEQGTSYHVTLKFDPAIFSSSNNVKLVVPPGKITTRSETQKPTELFQELDQNGGTQ